MKRQFFTEPDFDASQGKCCLIYINRKGARCILYWDVILFLVSGVRAVFAVRALLNQEKFAAYAKVRRVTFWLNCAVLFTGIFTAIIYETIYLGGGDYLAIFGALIAAILLMVVDFHWTNVALFQMRHPDSKPVDFLTADDEPRYAY